jgi:lipoprotein-anchoring transpeptidase ErfK/SrfK
LKRRHGFLLFLAGLNILTWLFLATLLPVREQASVPVDYPPLEANTTKTQTPAIVAASIPQPVSVQAALPLNPAANKQLSLRFPRQADGLIRMPANASRMIVVDQAQQKMLLYQQGKLLKAIPVSTGRPSNRTFTPEWDGLVGRFLGSGGLSDGIRADFIWFLFDGPEGRILIHSVPYRLVDGQKSYERLEDLGFVPSSNGCINLSPEDAAWLRAWNPMGTPIHISKYEGEILEVESGRMFRLP